VWTYRHTSTHRRADERAHNETRFTTQTDPYKRRRKRRMKRRRRRRRRREKQE
jgi:hypothetical protein